MASDSVNNKRKSEKRKNSVDGRKGKKSSVDGRSVSSMMRRKERGGCPALGEGLFPDVTTGCQVEFHGSDLRHNHSFHHIHVQEFYMCHNGHCMGQLTFTFIFMKLSLSHPQEFQMCHNRHRMGQFTFTHFHIHETFTFTTSGVLHVPQRSPHGPVHLSRRNSFLIAARDV